VRAFPNRWKNKKMLTFMHFIMEELFLLRKLSLVKEFRRFDAEPAKTIQALNSLRNAMAHDFLPERKRDCRKTGTVTWKGKDIYTMEGIERFDADMLEAKLTSTPFHTREPVLQPHCWAKLAQFLSYLSHFRKCK
jgi:hypothetical protein